ncbi:MAG: amino acid carrier protein [Bacteriovoracaceae bacterium]|nr:amino acid carrier protein [Bacteriovoracaceae bacterium]
MSALLVAIVDFVWGLPLVIFLFGANFILLYHSRFLPLRGVFHAVGLLRKKEPNQAAGQISHFQTFCNAIAATVGLGNISGVAIAITQGGPGAVFWMWVAAIIGMNTKFFECTAALIYRDKDYQGQIQGGAMYTIPKVLGSKYTALALSFALCGMIGTLSMFQINQLGSYAYSQHDVAPWMTGVFFSLITLWVLRGGLTRLSNFCSAIVPSMSVVYIITCLVLLSKNIDIIPSVFFDIFNQALNGKSALYGGVGYSFVQVMIIGVKRATFSNEAGLGTAPMAHSNSKTDEPVAEGYVSMLGPLLDTLVVCTLTALVILTSFHHQPFPDLNGIEITTLAFEKGLGSLGRYLLGISILLFAYSTMLGMANYNQKCWNYIFRGKKYFGEKSFQIWYVGTILMGSVLALENVLNIIDIAYALMTIPNIIVTVAAAPLVAKELKKYNLQNRL